MIEILVNNIPVTVPFLSCETCPLMNKGLEKIHVGGLKTLNADASCFILKRSGEVQAHVRGVSQHLNEKTNIKSNNRMPDISGTPPSNCEPLQPDFVPERVNISDIKSYLKLDFDREL